MSIVIFFDVVAFSIIADTETAKASRRQLKEAICTTLFNMNVPAVCAINQVKLLYALTYSAF